MNKKLLIKNGYFCSVNENTISPLFGDMLVEDGIITEIKENITCTDAQVIDAAGKAVTIPNVNFHDHIYSRLAKGLPSTGSMENFPEILENLWWKLDFLLDDEMNKASAYMAALESIKNGVTYIFDHHASPSHTIGSLNIIKDVLAGFNLRNVLCFETSDRNGKNLTAEALKENIDFIKAGTSESIGLFGLHASFTIDDDTLQKTAELLKDVNSGIHVHVCEDASDISESIKKYGKAPLQRLLDFGLVNNNSILAHGVHLTKDELQLLKNAAPAMVFNLDSNLNNSVGLPNFSNIPNELKILCGTDGMHANLSKSQKQLFLQLRGQKLSFGDTFSFFVKMYFNQIEFVKKFFPDYGTLTPGSRADFIIRDYVPPTPLHSDNFFGHYIYAMLESSVCTVVTGGKVLMNDYKLTNVNETEINNFLAQQGKRVYDTIK